MAKLLFIGTPRYSINLCDFDLMFRNSEHEIVKVLYHESIGKKRWFRSEKNCPGNRGGINTKLTDHPHKSWSRLEELVNLIEKEDFNYICLGNGNDETGSWLQRKVLTKYLFSEYGWLPWSECFYVDDKGTGPLSSLRCLNLSEMSPNEDHVDAIKHFKSQMLQGNPVPYKNFVYIPLQVDTPTSDGKPDFKFRFTGFKNNIEFLNMIAKIIPEDVTILVKNHPSNKRPTKVPVGMVDISKAGFSKYELYSRMRAMVAINSTSVLEAMAFGSHVFAYGQDIFSGKALAYEDIRDQEHFNTLLGSEPPIDNQKRFIGYLFQRQFLRRRWNDLNYVRSHYWSQSLSG